MCKVLCWRSNDNSEVKGDIFIFDFVIGSKVGLWCADHQCLIYCHVCCTLLMPCRFVFSFRSMKTPAWSRRPSRAGLTALTQPTCQPRDSTSRRHLGYTGVLFTMQHSVQHKKIRRERARESESVRNLIHCAWLVGSMAASYLREKCVDFIWHSRGTSPNEVWDGEWVRVRMSGYMLQKSKTSTSNALRDMPT